MGIKAATATAADERRDLLARFAQSELGTAELMLVPASGDASFRRYFRVTLPDAKSLIAMDAPPDREDLTRFVRIAKSFAGAGLHVPQVVAVDYTSGFAILGDLGSETYLMRLELGDDAAPLYSAAIEALVRLQVWQDASLPAYDAPQLDAETKLFEHWLLERHLGLVLTGGERSLLRRVRERLTELALAQPTVTVHRDYHSRNLMMSDPLPGVLDFQDAVNGPVSYDLVSLLEDCYVGWPAAWRLEWVQKYRECALAAKVPAGRSEEEFLGWFETMGIQRHLKAAGIFARLWRRDGKAGYLAALPRTLDYVIEAVKCLPEFGYLGSFVAARVLPALGAAGVERR